MSRKVTFIGSSSGGGGAPTGAAGGDLGGTYPNPTSVAAHWTQTTVNFAASPYTILATDSSLNVTAVAGNVTVNLPAATGSGKQYFIIKTDSGSNTVTIARNGADTIEGATSVVLSSQYDSLLIADSQATSWLKVSPKTPGTNGQVFFNSSGVPGAITGSFADNCVSLADCPPGSSTLANSYGIQSTRTWSVGDTSKAMHVFDANANYSGIAKENTLSSFYGTMTFTGSGGCQHCINVVSRVQPQGSGTIDSYDNYYADMTDSAANTSTITESTGYNVLTDTFTGAATWSNHAGFRYRTANWGAGITIATMEQAFVAQMPSGTNAKLTGFIGLRTGGCTRSASKYSAMCIDGGTSYFAQQIDQSMTLAANAIAPMTNAALIGHNVSNFLGDNSAVFNQNLLLTHSNGGTGTSVGILSKVDNGGNSTATKMSAFQAQCRNSGGVTTTKCIGNEILAPQNSGTYTNISGLEIAAQTLATNTNPARAINQLGASDLNVFAGAHSLTESGAPPSQLASSTQFYADSTAHEIKVATSGSTSFGQLTRVMPGAISLTGQTAAITTATLCAASAGACNVAGQYRISVYANSQAACGTAGSLAVNLTWADETATHTTQTIPLDQDGSNSLGSTLTLQATAHNATGSVVIWTNGTIIQYATVYTACTVSGTGTYGLRISVERLQ